MSAIKTNHLLIGKSIMKSFKGRRDYDNVLALVI